MFGTGMLTALGILLLISVFARLDALFLLSLALLVAAGLSRVWERYCLERLEYRRRFSTREAQFGETIDVEFEIVNRKPLPLSWLEIEDEIPDGLRPALGHVHPSHRPRRAVLASLISMRPYERVRRRYQFPCQERGEHILGPVSLRSGDLFGFVSREEQLDLSETFVVYPRVLPVSGAELPARHPLGDLRVKSWLFEDVTRVAGARDYRPGDGVRRIHWPASVRAQRLQSKVLESTTSHVVSLFLNLSTDDETGWGLRYDPEVLELGIVTAASLANWALEHGYQVGLNTNGTHRLSWQSVAVPAGRDPEALHRVLLALGRLQPFALGRFETTLRRDARDLPFGATVVVVTAGITPGLADVLTTLRRRGNAIAVVLTGRRVQHARVPGVRVLSVGPPESWRDAEELVIRPGGLVDAAESGQPVSSGARKADPLDLAADALVAQRRASS